MSVATALSAIIRPRKHVSGRCSTCRANWDSELLSDFYQWGKLRLLGFVINESVPLFCGRSMIYVTYCPHCSSQVPEVFSWSSVPALS